MQTWKTISVALSVLLLGAVAYLPLTVAQDEKAIEQKITEAKTPADHEAIAAYYDKQAQEAHQQQAEHQQFSKSYSSIPVLKTKTGAVAHCDSIAKKYEGIAKDYEALAKMHRDMAKAAK